MVIIATRKAEPVAFQVNSPVTRVSSHRTRNTTRPMNHRRRKSGSVKSPRRATAAGGGACRDKASFPPIVVLHRAGPRAARQWRRAAAMP